MYSKLKREKGKGNRENEAKMWLFEKMNKMDKTKEELMNSKVLHKLRVVNIV